MCASVQSDLTPKRTQKPCCYTSAMDAKATYCSECGKPLLRCMAFEECGGLLSDTGLCTVCVAPHMQMAAGALKVARVGGAVSLPLQFANLSAVGRPLFVTNIYSRESGKDWQEAQLGWERLNAGEQRAMTVRADNLDRAGVHNIDLLVAVSSRWRWREERFAFATHLNLEIEADQSDTGPVVNIGGESAGHGNTVYIAGQSQQDANATRSDTAIELALARAEKDERRLGLRGMGEASWAPRALRLNWKGFPDLETPLQGPILTQDSILAAGRSRSRREGGLGDLRILPETPDGAIDEDAARLISRRHFELYVESDRLVLRVTGNGGLRVNGEAFGRDKIVPLNDGDVIAPLVQAADDFALSLQFQTEHGRVSDVTITRTPASQRRG